MNISDLLHRPVPGLSTLSIEKAFEWFLDGLAVIAPQNVREVGWRPVYRFVAAGQLAGAPHAAQIERSWLGVRRLTFAPSSAAVPLAIDLARSDIFETSVDLPSAARSNLREAVAHRLDRLSPLPGDDVVFVVGPAVQAGHRIQAQVAIARKSTIDQLLQSSAGAAVGLIGAVADAAGGFAYVFYRRPPDLSRLKRKFVRLLAVLAGFALVLFGAGRQLELRIAAVSAHEAALLATLRAEKAQARFLKDPLPSPLSGVEASAIPIRLDRLSAAIPEVWLEEIAFEGEDLAAGGFVRRTTAWPEEAKPSLTPSDRPEVDRFTLRLVGSES